MSSRASEETGSAVVESALLSDLFNSLNWSWSYVGGGAEGIDMMHVVAWRRERRALAVSTSA